MARQYWPKGDAIGKRFKIGGINTDNPWLTVVGIYDNVRQGGLDRDPRPWFIRPYNQAGWPWVSIVTRTAAAPGSFSDPVKKAIAVIEPNQPVSDIKTMDQVVGDSVSSRRFPMLLLSGFAIVALLLAAVGIAGVVAYSVVQRTQEIGVRMALGAETRHVLQLVVGHSLWWTIAGVIAGVAASIRSPADASGPGLRCHTHRSSGARDRLAAARHRVAGGVATFRRAAPRA